MQKLSIGLAIAAFGLGALSTRWLSHRNEDRAGTQGEAEAEDGDPRAELERLRAERARLEAEVAELRDALEGDDKPRAAAAPPPGPPSTRASGGLSAEPWKPPVLSAEQRSNAIVHRNGELFRELALTQGEIDALTPVLAAQEQRQREQARASGRMRFGMAALSPEDEQRNRDEVAAVLGPEKAARLQTLQKSQPLRSEVRMLRDSLEQAGIPITEQQQRELMAKVTARAAEPKPTRSDGESQDDVVKRFGEQRRERAQRVREEAAAVLSPEQMKVVDQMEELRSTYESARPRRNLSVGAASGGSSAR